MRAGRPRSQETDLFQEGGSHSTRMRRRPFVTCKKVNRLDVLRVNEREWKLSARFAPTRNAHRHDYTKHSEPSRAAAVRAFYHLPLLLHAAGRECRGASHHNA